MRRRMIQGLLPLAAIGICLVLLFNNCGQGFSTVGVNEENSIFRAPTAATPDTGSNGSATMPTPAPTITPTPEPTPTPTPEPTPIPTPTPKPLPVFPANARIMMVGDSITEGGSDTRIRLGQLLTSGGQSYQFVGSRLNANIYHEGYSGYTAGDIDNLITGAMQKSTPDIVMMMIGTNDVLRSVPLNDSIKNINSIITKIHANRPGTMVFVAKILPNTRETAANVPVFNAALEASLKPRVAAGANLVIVDMNTGFSGADLLDGIHPGGGGFIKMAERWFGALFATYKK